MTSDNNSNGNPALDMQAILSAFEQKLAQRDAELRKELDIQANRIHSSYAKKLKASWQHEEEGASSEEGAPIRKPTKRELELQESVEKLVKQVEDSNRKAALASQKTAFVDHLLKNGFNPDAVETVYTLHNARNAFVDDGEGNFKVKTSVDGVEVALPFESAVKKYSQSQEAKLFLAPKGASGSGAHSPSATKSETAPLPLYRQVNVDWNAVADDMKKSFRQ